MHFVQIFEFQLNGAVSLEFDLTRYGRLVLYPTLSSNPSETGTQKQQCKAGHNLIKNFITLLH